MALTIAVRYLFSKKSHGAVNVISIISVAGVAVATAAIVIILSVFNGFTDLAESRLTALDPDLRVTPAWGKAISNPDSLADVLLAIDGVDHVTQVIEQRGLVICDNLQMPVLFKGVSDGYDQATRIDQLMIDGVYAPASELGAPAMQMCIGVASRTNARPGALVKLYVPRRVGRINPANPASSFREKQLLVSGIYAVQQPEYDADRVVIPIDVARELLDYDHEATALEIKLADGASVSDQTLRAALGDAYQVETRQQIEQQSFRMIMIEKWITFLMLAFILVIASFNIISTLSLLVIEKRDNMQTLRSLGAPRSLVRSVFAVQGCLITLVGGLCGIILGTALSLAQQCFHLITLPGDPTLLTIDYYPVRVAPLDLLVVLALVAVVGAVTSLVTRLFK